MSRRWVRALIARRCPGHPTEAPRVIRKGEWMEEISFAGIYSPAQKKYRCVECAGYPPPSDETEAEPEKT